MPVHARGARRAREPDALRNSDNDFTVLFDEGNTEFPRVDCATVHLRAIVKGLLH